MLKQRPFVLISFIVLTSAAAAIGEEAKKEVEAKEKPVLKRKDLGNEIKLFDGKTLKNWRTIDQFDFVDHGKIYMKEGSLFLEKGKPATGISWKKDLPRSNYEISLAGRRIDGQDFFCGLTFPVKKKHCSLILGGWGGSIVGLSNVDSFSAAENTTTRVVQFKNGQWYKIRLRVTDENISVWIDDEHLIDLGTQGHEFGIWWEQEPVRPLGIVTWYTSAELKDITFHELKGKGKGKADAEPKKSDDENDGKETGS